MKKQGRPNEYEQAIVSIIKGAPQGTHLTAEEVFAQAKELGLPVSISTVYRTLQHLKHVGNVSTVSGDRKLRYESADSGPEHDHLICLGCGLTIEFVDERLLNFGQTVAKRKGFLPVKSRFDILGYCEKCFKNSNDNKRAKIKEQWQAATLSAQEALQIVLKLNKLGLPENSSRMNAAKAFFRAMYAGDDVEAEQYGMNVETVKSGSDNTACSSCDNLASQVEQLETRANEMEGLYKRMAADFENYRKRVEREREELLSLGVQKGIEAILPALDDLDRAQSSFDDNSELAHVIESMKLIAERFNKCLEQLGVKPLSPVGQPFDPRLHEPVQQVSAPHLAEGSVAHDLRRGYSMGEKVIRPALVNVATSGPSQNNLGTGPTTQQNNVDDDEGNKKSEKDSSDNIDS